MAPLRYRLALDLGSTSLGWAMVRLNSNSEPCAVIRAGVRIFSDGRNPKDGSSLAVTRRMARAMRRRRDRLLKRKARMMRLLIEHNFFPSDPDERRAYEVLDPYVLRAKGLDEALTPPEFARALFHITQRRGFKSNRKTDKAEADSGALKTAIQRVRQTLKDENCRTVGEWLCKRHLSGQGVRARMIQIRMQTATGRARIDKSYSLYIDRAMVEAEFDALWSKQAEFNPGVFHEKARSELRDALMFQRKLRPVVPGRCTLLPDEFRAPLALPSTQRFRIYQEVNNLRIVSGDLSQEFLTRDQRDAMVTELERSVKRTFLQLRKAAGLPSNAVFNLEDEKRIDLKGNATNAILSRADRFGDRWRSLDLVTQDQIVTQLLNEESESKLIDWLKVHAGLDELAAEAAANAQLPEGYGSLSSAALSRILPALEQDVVPYRQAVIAGGFDHHSNISGAATGEILTELPYYGIPLQRHVGFGTGVSSDSDEKRYGRIANPTVHIGLNQVRRVVNGLIVKYGHPSEVILELARDLKKSREHRLEEEKQQAANQRRNEALRQQIADVLRIDPIRVRRADIEKMILWEELNPGDALDRRCPYSGVQISVQMLLGDEVEVEHILPFSETLDDSLNNKTVAMRQANRVKGNKTPWAAFGALSIEGFDYAEILERAQAMPRAKRYRFAEDGYKQWLRDDAGFLPRALNDTRYLSKVAKEYVSLICPQNTRVIPGRMTAMLRRQFGLNSVLGHTGEKNRDDHRHHAVDACVIAVTDQGMLQKFARASASARERSLHRLVEEMPLPWLSYREHVERAVNRIWVSHKPDHGYEGAMHNDTAYALLGDGKVRTTKVVDGVREREVATLNVIEFSSTKAGDRHGRYDDGRPLPYKGYKGDSNYCIEITRAESGRWEGRVVSTFEAYQIVRLYGVSKLRDPRLSFAGKPLVMRLMLNDFVRLQVDGEQKTMRVAKISGNGQVFMAQVFEANVDARNRDAQNSFIYTSKTPSSLQKSQAQQVTISPIGDPRVLSQRA